jgi:hypothetical protein
MRLDDGHSDPVSVALGIEPVCGVQYNTLTNIMVNQFTTEAGQENKRQLMKSNEVKGITSAILIYRSKRKPG